MGLESRVKKLAKRFLPLALASSIFATSLPAKEAEAQTQETCNVYRANPSLTDAVQTNDYRAMFGFDSCKIYSVQISGNERLILAEHPVTKNKWSVREINGQPGNAQEILNSADISNNVSVNLDGRAGDEQNFTHYTNPNGQTTVRSYPVSSSDRLIQDLSARNGSIVPNQAVQSFFQESQMPLNVKSVADANGRTYGFLIAGNGNQHINPQNAQFFDFQRKYPVGSIISGIEARLRQRITGFAGVDDAAILNGNGGPAVLFFERRNDSSNLYTVTARVSHYQTNEPINGARVIIGNNECITADGNCQLVLPASFTGVQDVFIDARNSGYVLRGFQQNFDGRNLSLEDRIVPVQKPGLTVAQEENDLMTFSWDLAEATARFEGADLSQLTTTGLVHGGHTVAYRNPQPRTRDSTGTRYMIITAGATSEMVREAEQAIIEVTGLAYGVTLTSNYIEKLSVLPPLSERPGAQYVFLWRDLGGDFGGTSQSLQGNYVIISGASVDPTIINPDARRSTELHEASRATGINRGTYFGELLRRYSSEVTNFASAGDFFRTTLSTTDRRIFDFFRTRFLTGGPGNTSTTKNVSGLGNVFILDYSPLNR